MRAAAAVLAVLLVAGLATPARAQECTQTGAGAYGILLVVGQPQGAAALVIDWGDGAGPHRYAYTGRSPHGTCIVHRWQRPGPYRVQLWDVVDGREVRGRVWTVSPAWWG